MNTVAFKRADEIAETFALIRKVHPTKLTLPCIKGITGELSSYPMKSVIADSIWEGSKAHVALMDVLHNSSCPHVAALLQALSDEYTDKNADDLDAYDEERGNV